MNSKFTFGPSKKLTDVRPVLSLLTSNVVKNLEVHNEHDMVLEYDMISTCSFESFVSPLYFSWFCRTTSSKSIWDLSSS